MTAQMKQLVKEAEEKLSDLFDRIDDISQDNTEKVLQAFAEERVSEGMFAPTSGYGYDDRGRDTLDRIYAKVFGAEAAFVRHSILSGTHALAIGLFGLLRPGDTLLALTGKPYDTLDEVIGIAGTPGAGSLKDFDVLYREVPLLPDGSPDKEGIRQALLQDKSIRVAFIQRSKGYLDRPTLSVEQIGELTALVKANSRALVMVDNCYGEFTERQEPTAVGVDLIAGSLIKNPGGGMAESGGYLAGTEEAVALCGNRFSAPGVGLEIGASLGQTKSLYKGLFFAPHTVAQALKTAHLAAYLCEAIGYSTEPRWNEPRYDIIQTIRCASEEAMVAFCRGIQAGSPVDAYVSCEPWDMPGYQDPVIMAAGTFTQGASLELSADGPVKPPYLAYLQGGLTYESGKYGVCRAVEALLSLQEKA